MKLIQRFLLWLIGVAIPVVIAACYGMPYRFSVRGRVIDAETREGIAGIKVTCVSPGAVQTADYTLSFGGFELDYDTPCDELLVEDVDGEENGSYQDKRVPFCDDCDESLLIELTPEP